jgi:hypothetical protein
MAAHYSLQQNTKYLSPKIDPHKISKQFHNILKKPVYSKTLGALKHVGATTLSQIVMGSQNCFMNLTQSTKTLIRFNDKHCTTLKILLPLIKTIKYITNRTLKLISLS